MLVVAVVAAIAWIGVMYWRRGQLLELSLHFHKLSKTYAELESLQRDPIGDIEKLEREVAAAAPPPAGSDAGARWLYREHVSELRSKLTHARDRLDEYERHHAVRRFLERVAAKYERAANMPWLRVEADPPPPT
jgi:hypothetical protein